MWRPIELNINNRQENMSSVAHEKPSFASSLFFLVQ